MIWITFNKEGIYSQPSTNEYDASLLESLPRHIFSFDVAIQVYNNDNSIEPVQLKDWIETMYGEGPMVLEQKSYAMLSDSLFEAISSRYPGRDIEISVSEGGDNGSTIRYSTHQPTHQLSI
jgi:hypothetical protein